MNRDFSRIIVTHVSGKNAFKRRRSKKRTVDQISQSSVRNARFPIASISRSALSLNATKTMNNSNQKKMNHQGQIEKEINQSNLVDCPRDSLPINSITNSTTCFDLSNTHRSFHRHHRISPVNCRDLFEGDFSFDIDEKYVES